MKFSSEQPAELSRRAHYEGRVEEEQRTASFVHVETLVPTRAGALCSVTGTGAAHDTTSGNTRKHGTEWSDPNKSTRNVNCSKGRQKTFLASKRSRSSTELTRPHSTNKERRCTTRAWNQEAAFNLSSHTSYRLVSFQCRVKVSWWFVCGVVRGMRVLCFVLFVVCCVVLCGCWCWCAMCVCCAWVSVWCVARLGTREKTCTSKGLRVYCQNARTCSTCGPVAGAHGDVLNVHTEGFFPPLSVALSSPSLSLCLSHPFFFPSSCFSCSCSCSCFSLRVHEATTFQKFLPYSKKAPQGIKPVPDIFYLAQK